MMLDPDAPPSIEGEFFLHMLKSNIPVSTYYIKYFSRYLSLFTYIYFLLIISKAQNIKAHILNKEH